MDSIGYIRLANEDFDNNLGNNAINKIKTVKTLEDCYSVLVGSDKKSIDLYRVNKLFHNIIMLIYLILKILKFL